MATVQSFDTDGNGNAISDSSSIRYSINVQEELTKGWSDVQKGRYQYQLRYKPIEKELENLIVDDVAKVVNSYASLAGDYDIGSLSITIDEVSNLEGFEIGDKIMIIQSQSFREQNNLGRYEINIIHNIIEDTIYLVGSTKYAYYSDLDGNKEESTKTQIVKVAEYNNLTINTHKYITCTAWNGYYGGIVAINANSIIGDGIINVTGRGYRSKGGSVIDGTPGEGWAGWSYDNNYGSGAGVGGYAGGSGSPAAHNNNGEGVGFPGLAYGIELLQYSLTMGSSGSKYINRSGAGGGVVYLNCRDSIDIDIFARGLDGGYSKSQYDEQFYGGAGSGGSIYVNCLNFNGDHSVDGGNSGGSGSVGYFLQN